MQMIYGKPFTVSVLCAVNSNAVALSSLTHLRFVDILRTIRDPEKPSTLEDLLVVYEEGIFIQAPTSDNVQVVSGDHLLNCFQSFYSAHLTQ